MKYSRSFFFPGRDNQTEHSPLKADFEFGYFFFFISPRLVNIQKNIGARVSWYLPKLRREEIYSYLFQAMGTYHKQMQLEFEHCPPDLYPRLHRSSNENWDKKICFYKKTKTLFKTELFWESHGQNMWDATKF